MSKFDGEMTRTNQLWFLPSGFIGRLKGTCSTIEWVCPCYDSRELRYDPSCSLCPLAMPFALWLSSSSSLEMVTSLLYFWWAGPWLALTENLAQSDSESTASLSSGLGLVSTHLLGNLQPLLWKKYAPYALMVSEEEKHMQHNWTELGAKPCSWSRTEPELANPETQLTSAEPSSCFNEWEINASGCMPSRLGNHSATQCFMAITNW